MKIQLDSKVKQNKVIIIGVPDFFHRQERQIIENTTFRKRDLFPPSDEERETPTVLGPVIEVGSF
jgi:hypothetical protein